MPPISGTSSRVGYAITNLDLSGFRLRKEDVEVQLVDLSGGLEVAVKEGGAAGSNGNSLGDAAGAVSSRRETADRGGQEGYANSSSRGGGGGAGGGAEDDAEMAAVPWGSSPADGAFVNPEDGSVVSPAEQRRQSAYTAVLGGVGSARLPQELQVSWDRAGEEGVNFKDGAEFDQGGLRGSASPPAPPPREEMAPAEVLRVVARGVRAEFKTLQWACRQVGPGAIRA